jgi:hypothetical protein
MLISPAVLALNLVSLTVSLLILLSAGFAIRVLQNWDITSGSELQLALERRTYLIATLITWCFATSAVSLLLFVYNAEQMSTQFVGAMCATGVLNANPWGWPTLLLKIAAQSHRQPGTGLPPGPVQIRHAARHPAARGPGDRGPAQVLSGA